MIRRAPRPARNWTAIPNELMNDGRISFRAKGILVYILSKPDHWRVNCDQLASVTKEGREAVRTAMRELAGAGYAVLNTGHDASGHFVKEWVVDERAGQTTAQETDVGSADVGELGRKGSKTEVVRPESKKYLAPTAPERMPARRPDVLFEAVAEACDVDWHALTETARGPMNRAVRELRSVGAEPGDLPLRAANYRALFPDAALTPMALAKHWPALARPPRPRVSSSTARLLASGDVDMDLLERGLTGKVRS